MHLNQPLFLAIFSRTIMRVRTSVSSLNAIRLPAIHVQARFGIASINWLPPGLHYGKLLRYPRFAAVGPGGTGESAGRPVPSAKFEEMRSRWGLWDLIASNPKPPLSRGQRTPPIGSFLHGITTSRGRETTPRDEGAFVSGWCRQQSSRLLGPPSSAALR